MLWHCQILSSLVNPAFDVVILRYISVIFPKGGSQVKEVLFITEQKKKTTLSLTLFKYSLITRHQIHAAWLPIQQIPLKQKILRVLRTVGTNTAN